MRQIGQFEGDFHFLSNFFIEPDGTTVEHEFQAEKTWDFHDRLKILNAETPGRAKRMGRNVKLRSDWDTPQANGQPTKFNVMHSLVFRKFWDHDDLARRLIDTGDAELIEGNFWHDNVWGICTCESCPGDGTNFLGIVLMEVRAVLL
jgi:ribA/ribD-fused uncharacterized protein